MPAPDLVVRLDAWLPQTQCTRCGYPDCRAYAEALAAGDVGINRCPPGGDVTLRALAKLLGVIPKPQPGHPWPAALASFPSAKPLDPACGAPAPRTRAVIDETRCIGCRKCLDVCPVDAIVGARQRMHTVIGSECNGCGLCAPPCPVDCIALVPFATPASTGPWPDYTQEETTRWRARTERRLARLAHRTKTRTTRRGSIFPDRDTIRRDIAAALDRTKAKRKSNGQDLQD